MTRIEDLQGRLGHALERIGKASVAWDPDAIARREAELEQARDTAEAALAEAAAMPEHAAEPEHEPAAPAIDPAEHEALRAALEEEQLANAQLEERVRQLKARQPSGPDTATLEEQLAAQREGLAQLDQELQRLKQAADMAVQTSQALREANEQGVGDPALINQAMLAEIEALHAARAAEAAELRAVKATLEPLIARAGWTATEAG